MYEPARQMHRSTAVETSAIQEGCLRLKQATMSTGDDDGDGGDSDSKHPRELNGEATGSPLVHSQKTSAFDDGAC